MALDAQNQAFLDQIAQAGGPPIYEMAVSDVRAMGAAFAELAGEKLPMADVADHKVSVSGGEIDARCLKPEGDVRGLIVWFHGGGWVFGNIEDADPVCRRLAQATACAVLIVDYRLAPENRYPTAAEDCIAATEWALLNVADLAGPNAPVLVGGDSAGGNLAAVVAQRLKGRLAGHLLVQPITDCDLDRPSYKNPENQTVLDRPSMVWFWNHYLPDTERRQEPMAAPLRGDATGLPPAIVITSDHDVLSDEGEEYVQKLKGAGVDVAHRSFAGQIHAFFLLPVVLPVADEALAFVADEVRNILS